MKLLICYQSKLESLDLSNNTSLLVLSLSENELDKLDINIDELKPEKEKEEKNEKESEEETILNKFNKAYSLTGEAKLPGIRDYVNYLVDNSCKFLIFAHHSEILDSIEDVIISDKIGYIRIDGKVPVEKRQDLVNKFQSDEE